MKVIKIDVKQEVMDLKPRREYFFRKLDEIYPARLMNVDEIPDYIVRPHTETYYLTEFYNPNAKEKRINYLIKRDDRGLVNDLVKIEQDVLEEKICAQTLAIYSDVRREIKKLSWWKRLFNKF